MPNQNSMKQNKLGPIIVTIIATIASFALGPVFWPDVAGMEMPSSSQIPFLMGVGIFEAIAFGIGVSFIIFGWKFLKGRSGSDKLAFFSIAWLLVSWWPHDNLHRITMHGDFWGLLKLEWGFHVTLIIAGVILASRLWKELMPRTQDYVDKSAH